MQKVVNVHPLKETAAKILPNGSILRRVLLSEPDEMEARDYIAKLGTYLVLLGEETAA